MPTNSAITFLGAQSGNTLATAVALSKLGDSFVAPSGVPKAGQTIFESDFVALTELASGYNVTYVTAANVATGLISGTYTADRRAQTNKDL